MSSKLFSRAGVFAWSPKNVEKKGLICADFAQFFDANATCLEQKIDFLPASRLLSEGSLKAEKSANSEYRFNELCWSNFCSEAHPSGIVAGGTEDGTVVIFDAEKLISAGHLDILSSRKDHHGHVLTIDVSQDGKWMASGGGNGQILLWDIATLQKTPFSPGQPNYPDPVKMLRWNPKNESVFASISSRRTSCWDLRRHGSPVLEFAELPGADWSSLAWNPTDASQLIVGSQFQNYSVVQKWDSRFTSTPVKEYRHHGAGVTALDWNKSDDRLLISAGCDGQVLIWNHENGEVLGGVGSLQGDWIRSVRWNEVEPAQFAIQYFQHPIQIGSLDSLGVPQPGAEVLSTRISDQFVPSWHRAPLIGSSVAMGGRMATFWKSYDVMSQKWTHNVELETIPPSEDLGAEELSQFLHILDDKRNLGWFLHEKATKNAENPEFLVWMTLLGVQEGAGRRKMLRYWSVLEENEGNGEISQVTQSTRSISVISTSSTTDFGSSNFVEKLANIDWKSLDTAGWSLLLSAIRQDHGDVIRILMTSQQHVAAMMYAARNEPNAMDGIMEDYLKAKPSPLSGIVQAVTSSTSSSEASLQNIDVIFDGFPDEKWKELLAVILEFSQDLAEIQTTMKRLGDRWREKYPLRACLAYIIAGDVDSLLETSENFPKIEQLEMAIILAKNGKFGGVFSPKLQQKIANFAQRLLAQGAGATAWNLVKIVKNDGISENFKELQFTCYNVAGGRECTGDPAPENPYFQQPETVQKVVPPTRRESNLAPMPPSSTFYQTPSWDHKPPPAMPPNMPPPQPAAPVTPGWNDPPAQVFHKKPEVARTNVMQTTWKPLEVGTVPSGTIGTLGTPGGTIGTPGMGGMMGMMRAAPSLQNGSTPSATSSVLPSPISPPIVHLSPEDEQLMEPINQLAGRIIENARVQAKIEKAGELKARIQAELAPRLANNRLSPQTKQHLANMAYFIQMQQYREAQAVVNQMARNATDFVEISAFLPSLKSLFSLAMH